MSITRLFLSKTYQTGILKQVCIAKTFANDAAKTSTAAVSEATPTAFPIDKPPLSIPQDPVKVTLQKPNLDLVVDVVKPQIAVDDVTKSVSFDDIPGPLSLRYLSRIWSTLPVIGTQVTGGAIQYLLSIGSQLSWGGNMWLFKRLLDEYGPVVRLHGPFGGDVVIVSRPEHVAAVFKNEGPYPVRSSLDSVEKYRLQHRKFKNSGPFLMFGPEWEKFRKSVEQPLQTAVSQQCDKIEDTCDRFIARIVSIRNRQDEVPDSFVREIHKWCLECFSLVTLNKRLGFLDPCGLSSTSDPGMLLEGFIGATEAIRRCEYGLHLWKFMNTPAWNSLIHNCDMIDNILTKYVQRTQGELREKKEGDKAVSNKDLSLLESVLLKHGIMAEDAMTILLDMMLIGINATSHTIAFLFYHLARYPKCQLKLYNEISRQSGKLSKEVLSSMPYLQACIKESLRLKPPVPILGRVLPNDISVHNYHIPKGTYLLMATSLSSLREEYFENAQKFMPERWLSPAEDTPIFASIPFGYGPKACMAKELAELEVGILITKILKKFRIEYLYGDINSTNRLLASPNKKLKFRFAERV